MNDNYPWFVTALIILGMVFLVIIVFVCVSSLVEWYQDIWATREADRKHREETEYKLGVYEEAFFEFRMGRMTSLEMVTAMQKAVFIEERVDGK